MCDSLEEGGARCAAHTRPAYAKVVEQLRAATEARDSIHAGYLPDGGPNTLAVVAHASTRTGYNEVTVLADELTNTDPDTADWLRHCVRAGEQKAEASRAVKEQIAQRSLRSALRRIGRARNPHRSRVKRHWMTTAADLEAQARYDTFLRLAEDDKTLRAPDGWIEEFKATGTHTRSVSSDRATAYALWRTQSTGSDFAPAHYDPDMCVGVVTRLNGFRPGDVIDEPGFRTIGAVEHEGKTIETIHYDDTGRPSSVVFTDGSSAMPHDLSGQYTVYRPMSLAEKTQMARYEDTTRRAHAAGPSGTGHIPGQGWFADDPDTGERVFDAWEV